MDFGREWAAVTGEVAPGSNSPERNAFERSGAEAFLAVPFVGLPGVPGRRRLVIGQARVLVKLEAAPQVRVSVDGVWFEQDGWHAEEDVEPEIPLPAPKPSAKATTGSPRRESAFSRWGESSGFG